MVGRRNHNEGYAPAETIENHRRARYPARRYGAMVRRREGVKNRILFTVLYCESFSFALLFEEIGAESAPTP